METRFLYWGMKFLKSVRQVWKTYLKKLHKFTYKRIFCIYFNNFTGWIIIRRTQRPYTSSDEDRYNKVKRSMAAIKHVLSERKKIDIILRKEENKNEDKIVT